MAEQNIKPETQDYLRGLLGIEPLVVTAIWADHVRDDSRFSIPSRVAADKAHSDHDFASYHFCEIPAGTTYQKRTNPAPKDCYGAVSGALFILKSQDHKKFSKAEQLLALKFLIHVLGDIHQPLHTGNGFDIGGNVCYVQIQKDAGGSSYKESLHSYWDNKIVQFLGDSYSSILSTKKGADYAPDYITAMKTKHPEMFTEAAKKQYGSGHIVDWLNESAGVRESQGFYPDDAKFMSQFPANEAYKHRSYCLWFSDQFNDVVAPGSKVDYSQLPVLGSAYFQQFGPVAELQLLKAGLRLAYLLDEVALAASRASPPAEVLTSADQEKQLSQVQQLVQGLRF